MPEMRQRRDGNRRTVAQQRLLAKQRKAAKEIEQRLHILLRKQGYQAERHISVLFGGFDASRLLAANYTSRDHVFNAVSSIAIENAERREKKLKTPKTEILGTDLIPALDFKKLTAKDKTLRRFWSVFAKSCPWCD
ncbi:MAG: hypothetical protein ACREO5_08565 [Candidatus Binatia bacterium]